ncbi:MAG TPA: DPP IV N-terminal domain-containing protein [Chitinophagaceae bacterium]|nr:DPP IV N-terminal domain-containing protein [Chitinophagaceae bacterium]
MKYPVFLSALRCKGLLTAWFVAACFLCTDAQPLHHAWSYQSLQFGPAAPIPALNDFSGIQWEKTGHLFTRLEPNDGGFDIVEYDPANNFSEKIIATSSQLIPLDSTKPLEVESYTWYPEHRKLLLFTDSKRVWRAHTRGDFWIYELKSKKLSRLGKDLPQSSLQFAKISPDGTKAAYVSKHNIYVEDLQTGERKRLTQDGTEKIINGTFDWAYEEELFCRDGFRWSPDSKSIAYWQINATGIRDYLMLNTTDSVYSFVVPVQYPKVGYNPSSAKIGVVNVATDAIKWMKIPGDSIQHYLPRMDWANNNDELMVQQFNRKQDSTWLYLVNVHTGKATDVYTEGDKAWIDINYFWQYDRPGWDWINDGKQFLWTTEKDGWRRVYRLNRDGSHERLITTGNYDVIDVAGIDRSHGILYFYASPDNATQQYLYSASLDGKGKPVRISPADETGTHRCTISPDGWYGVHSFSNHDTPPTSEFIRMNNHKVLKKAEGARFSPEMVKRMLHNPKSFFRVTTSDHVTMDGWMVRPADFDSTKKYPVLFYVYGEPAACTVKDVFSPNPWYQQLAGEGYVIISVDNRGTPAPKGRAWRKAILKSIGTLNIHDQAMAAEKILQWPWVDSSRIAVWGWSGGGSSTQNLMFQYPGIYQTGMAVAGVSNMLYYDNIYEERYMGLLPQDMKYYQRGASVNHAKGLQGNLLIIHGSGDDNVHYQNQEALINALVAGGKQFSMMEYPNRTHSISEGKGTTAHLYTLLTDYLEQHCPPGAR